MKKAVTILLISLICHANWAIAQNRRINPIKENYNTILPADIKNQKKPPFTKEVPGLKADTIIRDTLFIAVDTTKKHIKYPKLNSIIIGANIWDPIMRLIGQNYGGISFSAELSMWNRIFPGVELGIGMANNTPEEMNFTYKGKTSLYGKIGAKYNFQYNNSSDYQILIGANIGYSNFKYDITDISIDSDYWDEHITTSLNNLKGNALWTELTFSLKVKLIDRVSMGWSFIYHFLLSEKKNPNASAWYIPGFGTRNNRVTGAFSVFYTLPFKKNDFKENTKDIYTGEPIKN